MTHWASPLGRTVLRQIAELYRALVWEGFILLAVAADEDNSVQPADVITNKQPNSQNLEPRSATESGAVDVALTPGHMEVEVVRTPPTPSPSSTSIACQPQPVSLLSTLDSSPMETTDTPTSTEPPDTSKTTPNKSGGGQLQHSSILVESLKQLAPLLTVTSRVGRSLAELMSLLVRLSTSPLHRTHRRGAGHSLIIHGYFETSKEAMDVCTEITNLLADSLCWEVPMPRACSSAMQSPIRDWLFAG